VPGAARSVRSASLSNAETVGTDEKGFRQREWLMYDGNFVPPNLSYNDVPPNLAIGPYPQVKILENLTLYERG